MNLELIDVQVGFRKGRGIRDQIPNKNWIIEKARGFHTDYTRAFDYMGHNKLWTILKEMGITDHLTCLLRNLYTSKEAIIRTGHGIMDWFKVGK